jgi:hypothetical protein
MYAYKRDDRPVKRRPLLNSNRKGTRVKTLSRRLFMLSAPAAVVGGRGLLSAQDSPTKPTFKAKVDLVVLTFTVTDSRGRYINNLKPGDFKIT